MTSAPLHRSADASRPPALAETIPTSAPPEILSEASRRFLDSSRHRLLKTDPEGQATPRLEDILGSTEDRIPAQLAFALQQRIGVDPRPAAELAVAIEALHLASRRLTEPSISNELSRPGATHRGGPTSVPAAIGRIHRGYALLWGVLGELPPTRRRWAAQEVAGCLGNDGPSGAREPEGGSVQAGGVALSIARRKAVPPIRLALVLPAIVAGVTTWEHGALERLAEAWGLARQALDDLATVAGLRFSPDLESQGPSPEETEAPSSRCSNLAQEMGFEPTLGVVDRQLVTASEALEDLGEVGAVVAPFQRHLGQRRLELGARLESNWRTCAGG